MISSAFSESANRKYLARQNPKTKLIVCFVQGYNTMVKRLGVTQEVTPIDPFFLSSFLSLLGGEDPIYSDHWPMPWKVFPNQFAKCCLRLFKFRVNRGVSVEEVPSEGKPITASFSLFWSGSCNDPKRCSRES